MLRFFLLLISFFSLSSLLSANTLIDKILVQVDDRIITLVAFEEAFAPVRTKIESSPYSEGEKIKVIERYKKEVLDQMIEQLIADIAVTEAKIEVSDEELEEYIENTRRTHGFSREELERELMIEGIDVDGYYKQVRDQLLRSKLINYKVRSRIIITEEDIKAYYLANRDRFGGGPKYRLAHILLVSSSRQDAELSRRGEAIYRSLMQGEDFALISERESASPFAAKGGEIGWFELSALSPEIRGGLAELKEGEISKPLNTPQGLQIFKLLEVKEEDLKFDAELEASIYDELYELEINRRFDEWITELRAKVHVRILE